MTSAEKLQAAKRPTKAQERVLKQVEKGKTAEAIAAALGFSSANSVYNHVRKLKEQGHLPADFSFRPTNGDAPPAPASSNGRSGLGEKGLDVLREATEKLATTAQETEKEVEARRQEIATAIEKHTQAISALEDEDSELQAVVAAARNVEDGVGHIEL